MHMDVKVFICVHYWGDHNMTPYDYSKSKPAWRDFECYKRFEYVFLITNWF